MRLGVAAAGRLDQSLQRGGESVLDLGQRLAARAGAAHLAGGQGVGGGQLRQGGADGPARNAGGFGDEGYAAVAECPGLGRGPEPTLSLVQSVRQVEETLTYRRFEEAVSFHRDGLCMAG